MKLLASLLFSAAVKAEGDMPAMDHSNMDHSNMGDMGMDMEALDAIAVETTAMPTMEDTTGHHMDMMTHPDMEHHDMDHDDMEHHDDDDSYYEEDHHEEHKEEHHEEHHAKPCNSCGCNAEEMAQWKESMMVWKADHHGKSDFSISIVQNTFTIVVFPFFNEVNGLNESYMTANHFLLHKRKSLNLFITFYYEKVTIP